MNELLPIDFKKYSKEYAIEIKNIQEYFRVEFNLPIYLIYGTLLGCVRDNKFIIDDDDIDVAYLSNKTNEYDVKQEMLNIYKKLQEQELITNNKRFIGQAWLYNPAKTMMVDLWTSWISENNKFYCVNLNDGEFHKDSILPFAIGNLMDLPFYIPKNNTALLQYWYGDWQIPLEKKSYPRRNNYYLPKFK